VFEQLLLLVGSTSKVRSSTFSAGLSTEPISMRAGLLRYLRATSFTAPSSVAE
jgi:hypothetical protein